MGTRLLAEDNKGIQTIPEDDEELDLLEEDIKRSSINGVPTIDFSERINNFLIKKNAIHNNNQTTWEEYRVHNFTK